ncbi:flagellar hook-associated protein FlgK [Chenggangzhangella methanolivorans]|uniref:Flagellar hook-associated protein 1 n=1 Tax=Chenggangzhangella methanolivorans TaxID=1437009 RepID=A0A9E6RH91_9HYPH|nr:flagellar hook-associated protein FlgK [Chenggangzhangella methanolivorans]QZO00997.1 flagellar hook-associated protein FlgK [Chenggangzhangella methanolivorans]
MGLSSALGAALSGLKASQAGLDLVASNVANANTVGYVKRSLVTEQSVAGGVTTGVRVDDIRRELDAYLQRQLRTESSGAAYASTRATYLSQLQSTFGTPGGDLSLDTLVSDFSSSLDALATTPDNQATRAGVLAAAQTLAQQLNAASTDVQALRSQADLGMKSGVDQANAALKTIEKLNKDITVARANGQTPTGLLDQRDQAIDALSGLMDVKIDELADGQLRIKTQSGLSLFEGGVAATLEFEPTSTIVAGDSVANGSLGTIKLTRPSGFSADLLADGALRSGALKSLADLRDKTLPQAQGQLDELAANLAQAFSSKTVAGTAITGGVDLTTQNALAGDRLSVSYTSGGVTKSVTIVNVGDPSALPLDDALTADPNDTVIGVDFSSPTAAADLDAALAAKGIAIDASASATGFAFTSGDPALMIAGGSSKLTATALSGDGLAIPLFVDGSGSKPFSGSLDGGSQQAGFAARITVNPALLADDSKLVAYDATTAAGDPARAEYLRDALTADRSFSASSGLGSTNRPFTGSIAEFANGVIANQASASASATRVADGQSLVVSTLTDSYSAASGVNTDEEMGRLIQLQTAYGANARVISTVKEMMDMLMNI